MKYSLLNCIKLRVINLSEVLKKAIDKQKKYRFVKELMIGAYDNSRDSKKKRRLEANLFVGEWAKLLGKDGKEAKIKFRGGEGYVPEDSIGEERVLEIYFIDVGQGDAILIQTPDDKRVLIDGGKDESAYSFIKWKYRLSEYYKDFEAIIMTHGDEDHSAGLFHLLEDDHVLVKRIYHNGIAKRKTKPVLGKMKKIDGKNRLTQLYNDIEDLKPFKNDLTKTYKKWYETGLTVKKRSIEKGIDCKFIRADQNTQPLVIGSENPLKITFVNPINLGKKASPELQYFGGVGETLNGNSVAVLVEYGKAKILLCGDMNQRAEKLFLEKSNIATPLAQVFKANHHGSQDFASDFLKIVQPWITVVSSSDDPDYGHPRAMLLGSLGRYAPDYIEKPLLFSTEIAATFKPVKEESLKKGNQLYEKSNHGLINVRTNGEWLAAGRVYNIRKKEKGKYVKSIYDWEKYAFNLKNGIPLKDNLKDEL